MGVLSHPSASQECRQLDIAMDDFCTQCGVSLDAPRVLLGDLNDPPDVVCCPSPARQSVVSKASGREGESGGGGDVCVDV